MSRHRPAIVGSDRRRRPAVGVLLVLALAGAGCTVGHNSLGTSSSPCFQALPVASAALHNHGQLVGIRVVEPDTAQDVLAGDTTVTVGSKATATDLPADSRLCLVAFQGNYGAGSVDGASASSAFPGRYAIVAVGMNDHRKRGLVVTNRLPLRFRHL